MGGWDIWKVRTDADGLHEVGRIRKFPPRSGKKKHTQIVTLPNHARIGYLYYVVAYHHPYSTSPTVQRLKMPPKNQWGVIGGRGEGRWSGSLLYIYPSPLPSATVPSSPSKSLSFIPNSFGFRKERFHLLFPPRPPPTTTTNDESTNAKINKKRNTMDPIYHLQAPSSFPPPPHLLICERRAVFRYLLEHPRRLALGIGIVVVVGIVVAGRYRHAESGPYAPGRLGHVVPQSIRGGRCRFLQ